MAFNLPSAQSLHVDNGSQNVGNLNGENLGNTKPAGNLPITSRSTQCANETASNATGTPAGVLFGINGQSATSTVDASVDTRVLVWSLQYNAPNRIQSSSLANGGSRFRLGSGSNPTANYKEFFIGGNDTPFCSAQGGPVTMCIDLADTSHDSTTGTFDLSAVSAYGHASVRFNLSGNATCLTFFQRSFLFTTTKGSTNLPTFTGAAASFDNAVATLQGTDYTTKIGSWITKSGSSIFLPCPFSIGDGSTATTFNDNGASIISPASNAASQENFRLTNSAMRVYLDLRDNSADTVTLSGAYSWGTLAPWNFNQNDDAVITLAGATFSGMGDFTVGSSVSGTATWSLGGTSKVVNTGSNISGTINGKMKLTEDQDLTNLTITGDLVIDISADTTLTFDNVKVNGTVTNSKSNKRLTILAINGSSLTASDPGTTDGKTNIESPVTVTVTCNDADGVAVQGARVFLKAGSTVLVSSLTNSSGVVSFTYNYEGDQAVSGYVRKGSSSPFYKQSTIGGTIISSGLSVVLTMVQD